MTNNEKLIAARLLRLAAETFSNHGCNDFELEDNIENFRFVKSVSEGDSIVVDVKKNIIYVEDWLAMEYCAKLLEQECENG